MFARLFRTSNLSAFPSRNFCTIAQRLIAVASHLTSAGRCGRWLQSKHGRDKIGKGRAEVKARLEKRYSKGKKIISQPNSARC